jgi:hypothetical protein
MFVSYRRGTSAGNRKVPIQPIVNPMFSLMFNPEGFSGYLS